MEKIKFDISGAAEKHNEEKLQIGEQELIVRDHIPLDDKIKMATELVQVGATINEEQKLMSKGVLWDEVKLYLIMKFYTNLDVEDLEFNDVVDWVINNNLPPLLEDIIYADIIYVEGLAYQMLENSKAAYDKENSLSTAIMTTFGFLLNGEDITETLAKSREISEQMLTAAEQMNKSQQKADAGKVKVGGNIINIGKKK